MYPLQSVSDHDTPHADLSLFQPRQGHQLQPPLSDVSQSNSSLKKQRSRGIFSTFFCCFQNYNVEPPSTNNNTTSSLPPPVEENGTLPKVRSSCALADTAARLQALESDLSLRPFALRAQR
ncbi:hypothetical protein JZ751_003779 [Albula glossodonta]|uniref:Uncharacterized protein n=1 Tax=Albula glossodonta TaxID=121402 RepID=A0A8T2P5F9_9TELE|nr:hypothetical protein JZ751_003779 [Albula glossodonta]